MMTSEREFQAHVFELARMFGWERIAHFRAARTKGGWATAMSGDVGFPDLVLVRPGDRVVFAELKSDSGKIGPGQAEWLDAIRSTTKSPVARLWRPDDLDGDVMQTLR